MWTERRGEVALVKVAEVDLAAACQPRDMWASVKPLVMGPLLGATSGG